MAKDYTLDKVEDLMGFISFNHKTKEEKKVVYYIIRLQFSGQGVNGGATKRAREYLNVGTPRTEPFTPQEIYQRVNALLGASVSGKLKDLYQDLIDEDIS